MIVEEKIPFLEGKKYIVFAPNDIIKCSDSVWLKPKKTLIFVYEKVSNGVAYEDDDDELEISYAFGDTEENLKRDIILRIIFMWEFYVEEDDSKLVPKAQDLKYRYKEIFDKLEVVSEK